MEPVSIGLGIGALTAGLIGNFANMAHNESLTKRTWERDDNAVSRRMLDLQNAGLSPTLAAGSAANTSQPVNNSNVDFTGKMAEVLGVLQQKADISKTNADTELTNFMQNTEQWKQKLMSSQVQNYMANTLHLEKENRLLDKQYGIFDLMNMSKINLHNAQAQNYLKNAELLGAQTIYKQNELDLLKTSIDNAKIMRDFNNFNLSTSGIRLMNDVYRDSKGIFGKLFGDFRSPFVNFDIKHAIDNMDTSFYWDRQN